MQQEPGECRHIQEASSPTHWFSIYSDEGLKDRRSIQIKSVKSCISLAVTNMSALSHFAHAGHVFTWTGGKKFLSATDDASFCNVCDVWLILLLHFPENFPSISLPLAQLSLTPELVWLRAFTFWHTHGPIFKEMLNSNCPVLKSWTAFVYLFCFLFCFFCRFMIIIFTIAA